MSQNLRNLHNSKSGNKILFRKLYINSMGCQACANKYYFLGMPPIGQTVYSVFNKDVIKTEYNIINIDDFSKISGYCGLRKYAIIQW